MTPAQFKQRFEQQKTHNDVDLVPFWKSVNVTSMHFETCGIPDLCEVEIRMPRSAESKLATVRYSTPSCDSLDSWLLLGRERKTKIGI
jgi:hypothetical protein